MDEKTLRKKAKLLAFLEAENDVKKIVFFLENFCCFEEEIWKMG